MSVVVEPAWRQELVSEPFKYQLGSKTGSPEENPMHRAETLFLFLITTLTLTDCPEARMSTDEKRAVKTKKELFMFVVFCHKCLGLQGQRKQKNSLIEISYYYSLSSPTTPYCSL